MNDRYEHWYKPGEHLSVCTDCGSLVPSGTQETHDRFHEKSDVSETDYVREMSG